MRLYLVQHAEAKSEAEDPRRDLTDKGRAEVAKVANFLEPLNLNLSRVLHSGKTRAQSTADILAASLKPAGGVAQTDGLAPLDDPQVWADRVLGLAEDTMLVGHLPHLARLASLLLCGDPEKGAVNFKMGGVVCLSRSPEGRWGLEWMVVPEALP
ncbi:MAG: phosphohistidine phosphatase SixA [Deltaproteobacteria bacterium]|nr:phosphohistidine phosphatase SixA [Deltaproteobacteria bacterium]